MKRIGILICIIIFGLLTGCGQSNQDKASTLLSIPYKQTEFILGTVVTIKIYDEGKEEILATALERIRSLEKRITINESGSEVVAINQNAGIKPVKVSEDIFHLISVGSQYGESSNGSFDISIGPLTALWHIGYSDARKPSDTEIRSVLGLIDYKDIELNQEEQTVFLKRKGMELDLGAIAKGYIADEVAKHLKENEVTTAIIDLGGNIYVMGKNPSQKEWIVGIQNPFTTRGEIIGKLTESNKSIVTSGIYERFLEVEGKKYHHLLNPRDGYPFENDIVGVSIISPKSIDGDALSTTVFSKGLLEGVQFIEAIEGVEAIFICKDKKIYVTDGLKGEFELTNEEFVMRELPAS